MENKIIAGVIVATLAAFVIILTQCDTKKVNTKTMKCTCVEVVQ